MYKIHTKNEVHKELRKIPPDEIPGIIKKVEALRENPRPLGCKKLVGSINDYRITKGDYRILYTIDDENKIIRIYRIKHRREAYRRLWF